MIWNIWSVEDAPVAASAMGGLCRAAVSLKCGRAATGGIAAGVGVWRKTACWHLAMTSRSRRPRAISSGLGAVTGRGLSDGDGVAVTKWNIAETASGGRSRGVAH